MTAKLLLISFGICFAGCATSSSGRSSQFSRVEYGRPNKVVDNVGWILSIPEKVILWNRKIDNHDVCPQTVAVVEKYLDYNSLEDVKIRVNQYDPAGEWVRLTQNHRVARGWRYTLGALHLIDYTIFPGRLFGGDKYNPYTNSIYVYSDVPEMPLAEAGYAKDVRNRRYPGTYAAVNDLPLANMWHESIATKNILNYMDEVGTYEEQVSARHVLCARYGLRAGHSAGIFFGATIAIPLELGGAAIGHATGRLTAPAAEVAESNNVKPSSPLEDDEKLEAAGESHKIDKAGYGKISSESE